MEFTMRVTMDNAAFEEYPLAELHTILGKIRADILSEHEHGRGRVTGSVLDSNGNTVGTWEIKA